MSGTLAQPYPAGSKVAEPGSRFEIDALDMITVADGKLTAKHTVPRLAGGARSARTRMSAATGSAARHADRRRMGEGFAAGWRPGRRRHLLPQHPRSGWSSRRCPTSSHEAFRQSSRAAVPCPRQARRSGVA